MVGKYHKKKCRASCGQVLPTELPRLAPSSGLGPLSYTVLKKQGLERLLRKATVKNPDNEENSGPWYRPLGEAAPPS